MPDRGVRSSALLAPAAWRRGISRLARQAGEAVAFHLCFFEITTRGPTMKWPKIITPLPGPRAKEIIALDHAHMSPSLTRLYPFVAGHGEGCWVWDVDGNLFLDCTAGIAVNSVGYGHSRVTAAVQRQLPRLMHFSVADFYHAPAAELAARLSALFPGGATPPSARVFLCNSGAEAVETALKLARYHTSRQRFVAFKGAFHGRTSGALTLSNSKTIHKQGFGHLLSGVTHVSYSMDGLRYLENTVLRTIVRPQDVAAVFVEPIQGEAGVVMPPAEFLPELRRLCDRHGILLVADEVQTGMGRTGKMFACQHWEVTPDIICLAKGIASGLPLGAVLARAELMDWPAGAHTSTFGGNPLSCVAALATIELLQNGLIDNARVMGELLMRGLRDLAGRFEPVGEVRGRGLLIGFDVRQEFSSRWKRAHERDALLRAAFEHGLLLLGGGESVVRFTPPLIINAEEVEVALEILETAVTETLGASKAA
jgi:4-aminobutyrate aminotransferase